VFVVFAAEKMGRFFLATIVNWLPGPFCPGGVFLLFTEIPFYFGGAKSPP